MAAKNGITEKHNIPVNVCNMLNFYLSAYRYVCKSNPEVAYNENHAPGLLRVASLKTKKLIAGFRATCATNRKSTKGETSHGLVKRQKSLTNLDLLKFSQKGVSEATLSFLVLLRSGELLIRWTLLNSHSNEMKKYSLNLLPKFDKWCQPKKNWKPAKYLE